MPSIMVVTHTANGGEAAVFLAERLTTVQALKWAGGDAEHAEHERPAARPRTDQARAPAS